MPDMLVKLYALPELETPLRDLRARGIELRPALPPERHVVKAWVKEVFGAGWASECSVAFARVPVACHLAVMGDRLVGFACYDATCRGFFGPMGVAESHRGQGVGGGLLLGCLHTMRTVGYGYAIIGGAGPVDFYRRVAGAQPIEDSQPGIYRGMLPL